MYRCLRLVVSFRPIASRDIGGEGDCIDGGDLRSASGKITSGFLRVNNVAEVAPEIFFLAENEPSTGHL